MLAKNTELITIREMSELRVEALYEYPIKSCAGTKLPAVKVMEQGLGFDRFFMLVGENNEFISQRTEPRLALVKPAIVESHIDGDLLVDLFAPGIQDTDILYIPNPYIE